MSTYSARYKLELMATGANANTWGTNTNNNLNVLDAFSAGYISKSVAAVSTTKKKVAPKLFNELGSVGSLGAVVTIEGKVNLPSASLQVSTLPECASTVKVVSAVKLTTAVLPADMNPDIDLTGPEKVDLAIISPN